MFQGSIDNSITKQVQYEKGRRTNIIYTMKHPAVTRFPISTHICYICSQVEMVTKKKINQGLDVTL